MTSSTTSTTGSTTSACVVSADLLVPACGWRPAGLDAPALVLPVLRPSTYRRSLYATSRRNARPGVLGRLADVLGLVLPALGLVGVLALACLALGAGR